MNHPDLINFQRATEYTLKQKRKVCSDEIHIFQPLHIIFHIPLTMIFIYCSHKLVDSSENNTSPPTVTFLKEQ
jgi:hypothetical protein